jgi:N-acetyl-1-D-myo-inositol-2-amino-2-deoxy-alpha-D-glucopyranoside deacetylase
MGKIGEWHGKKILAVLAHPDDETFGMGGTLALYARRGVQVDLVCATRGEVGEVDEKYLVEIKSTACLRTQELKQAAAVLGLHEVIYLNYRDSGMPGSPENVHPNALAGQPIVEVAGRIAHIIRQVRPEVVITFDPIGGYRHPDHIAIHQATVLAFKMAAGEEAFNDPDDLVPFQAQYLYFHTINRRFIRMVVFFLKVFGKDPHHFGRNKDIDIADLAGVDFPTHVRINYLEVAAIREQAVVCHASQGGDAMGKGIQGLISRLANSSMDSFMQAYPLIAAGQKVQNDLFYLDNFSK